MQNNNAPFISIMQNQWNFVSIELIQIAGSEHEVLGIYRGLAFMELTGEHPELSLTLHGNPLRCDAASLCWLTHAQRERRLDLDWVKTPICDDWVNLDCGNKI